MNNPAGTKFFILFIADTDQLLNANRIKLVSISNKPCLFNELFGQQPVATLGYNDGFCINNFTGQIAAFFVSVLVQPLINEFDSRGDMFFSIPENFLGGNEVICKEKCLNKFGAPCITFCPAGVYESIQGQPKPANPSNCLHCKTCQRKCPYDNIRWTVPEPTGGPRYKTM